MARRFDHLVLCVADLDRARADYAALGFALTPPAAHPFGTGNSLVQFAGRNFLEVLAIRDPSAIPPHAPGRFSFAASSQAFLDRRGEGASMLVFASEDARADVAAFRAAGLRTYEPFDFGREAIQPDGSVARLGFSLAFVTHPDMPDAAFFTCQHRHPPEQFWKPEFQRHENSATGFIEIVMSAGKPPEFRDFFERLTGSHATATERMLQVGPATDRITVMRPDALAERYPELPGTCAADAPRLLACRVTVDDVGAARRCLARHAIAHRVNSDAVIVPPSSAHGILLELTSGG